MILEKNFNLKLEVGGITIKNDHMLVNIKSTGDILSCNTTKKTIDNFDIVVYTLNNVAEYEAVLVSGVKFRTDMSEVYELDMFFDKDIEFYKAIQPMVLEYAKDNKLPNHTMDYNIHGGYIIRDIIKDIESGITSGVKLERDPNLTIKWNVTDDDKITFTNMHFSKTYTASNIQEIYSRYIHFAKVWSSIIVGKYDWSLIE